MIDGRDLQVFELFRKAGSEMHFCVGRRRAGSHGIGCEEDYWALRWQVAKYTYAKALAILTGAFLWPEPDGCGYLHLMRRDALKAKKLLATTDVRGGRRR